jgi:hypothetical protein
MNCFWWPDIVPVLEITNRKSIFPLHPTGLPAQSLAVPPSNVLAAPVLALTVPLPEPVDSSPPVELVELPSGAVVMAACRCARLRASVPHALVLGAVVAGRQARYLP